MCACVSVFIPRVIVTSTQILLHDHASHQKYG